MPRLRCPLVLVGLAISVGLLAQSPIPPRAQCFPLSQVRLLPGELKADQDAMLGYLRTEDLDRLLHNFRVQAGLPSTAKPLAGWEAPECELRGHYTGHFLSALALMYESTGEATLRERGAVLVHGLAECQQKLGGGYLSAFPLSFLERLARGERVWAPWYTLHKIAAGLLDQHVRCGNAEALQVAIGFAAFVETFTKALDDAAMQRMLQTEFGGMPAFCADLYAVTKDPRHLALARRFTHHKVLDPLGEGRDELKGLHANTQIPKVIAQARLFELTGDPWAGKVAQFFWQTVTGHRCYATGGTSSFEYWRDAPDKLSWQLSSQDAENCCTHNLLKLTKLLWQQTPNGKYADYYERALWNGILGTKSPDDPAAIMYYVPMQGGLYRYYGEGDNGYVCCSGTGIESFSRLGEFVYAHDADGLWVNLFTPSEVDWAAKGLRVTQTTRFPDEAKTTLKIAAKAKTTFMLHVREPFWCRGAMQVAVNGAVAKVAAGDDGYAAIAREWQDGDTVEVTLPMTLRCEPLGDDANLVALCYGPVVLAADRGRNAELDDLDDEVTPGAMTKEMQRGLGAEAYRRAMEGAAMDAPCLMLDPKAPQLWHEEGTLRFHATKFGGPFSLELQPFYRVRGTRYAIYVHTTQLVARLDRFADGTDSVNVGTDRNNNFQAWQFERGESHGKAWVRSPLWFRYDLDVGLRDDNVLRLEFARDEDATTFELCVDGVVVATPTLQAPPGDAPLFFQEFTLPRSATDGHKRVAIMIRVPPAPKADAATPSPRRTPRVFSLATNPMPDYELRKK